MTDTIYLPVIYNHDFAVEQLKRTATFVEVEYIPPIIDYMHTPGEMFLNMSESILSLLFDYQKL